MKLYHLSDLHLGVDPPALGRVRHRRLVFEKMKELAHRALEEGVRFLLLAGDVFDSNAVSTELVLSFLELLASFEGLNFVLIPGGGGAHREVSGHDAYTPDSVYRRLEVRAFFSRHKNLHLLTPEEPVASFPEEDVSFYGGFFAYPRARLREETAFHVALLHGPFGERADFGEISLRTPEAQQYDYLALGHYHSFRRLTPRAAYSGAFLQFEFLPRAEGVSGYVEVELSPSEEPRVIYHSFPDAPRFIYHELFTPEDLRRLEETDFEHTYVKITGYLSHLRPKLEALKARYPERVFFAEAAELEPEAMTFVKILEDILARRAPEELRQEVKELLLYGLQVSAKRPNLERFLKDKYGLW